MLEKIFNLSNNYLKNQSNEKTRTIRKKTISKKVKIMTIGNMKTVRGGDAGADGNDDPSKSTKNNILIVRLYEICNIYHYLLWYFVCKWTNKKYCSIYSCYR